MIGPRLVDMAAAATLTFVLTAGAFGYFWPAPTPKPRPIEEDVTFVAIVFLDFNEMTRVVFLSSYGRAESVRIKDTMTLYDTQLRLATIPYEFVYWVVNDRSCGWKADEAKPA